MSKNQPRQCGTCQFAKFDGQAKLGQCTYYVTFPITPAPNAPDTNAIKRHWGLNCPAYQPEVAAEANA